MQLSVIMINYKTPDLTVAAVKAVYAAVEPKSALANNFEVIVVDNHSQDETLKLLAKLKKPRLKLIANPYNNGFGAGNNLGFKQATGQYVLFLNSDTITKPGSLEKLLAYYQAHEKDKHPLGLLAAQLLNRDGTFQPQGGDLPSLGTIATTMFLVDDLPILRRLLPAVQHTGRRFREQEVREKEFIAKGWVGGTALLVKRDWFEDYGKFDENIFMYGEDQELAYRFKSLGYRAGILTTSEIIHLGSASSSSKSAILGEIKGYFYFFRKYKTAWQLTCLQAILWWAMLMRVFLYAFLKKDPQREKIYAAALEWVQQVQG